MHLTKEQMLAADDLAVKAIEIPEWSGSVFIRQMSGLQQQRFELAQAQGDPLRSLVARMVLCDESGNLLYTDEDLPLLSAKSSAALDRIFAASAKHPRMTPEVMAELKAQA